MSRPVRARRYSRLPPPIPWTWQSAFGHESLNQSKVASIGSFMHFGRKPSEVRFGSLSDLARGVNLVRTALQIGRRPSVGNESGFHECTPLSVSSKLTAAQSSSRPRKGGRKTAAFLSACPLTAPCPLLHAPLPAAGNDAYGRCPLVTLAMMTALPARRVN